MLFSRRAAGRWGIHVVDTCEPPCECVYVGTQNIQGALRQSLSGPGLAFACTAQVHPLPQGNRSILLKWCFFQFQWVCAQSMRVLQACYKGLPDCGPCFCVLPPLGMLHRMFPIPATGWCGTSRVRNVPMPRHPISGCGNTGAAGTWPFPPRGNSMEEFRGPKDVCVPGTQYFQQHLID